MIHLATLQLSSNSPSVVFEAIPQTYGELIFALELRSTGTEAQRWNRVDVTPGPATRASTTTYPFWPGLYAATGTGTAVMGAGHAIAANSLSTAGTFAYNFIRFPSYAAGGGSFAGLSTQANLVNGGGVGLRTGGVGGPITTLTFTNLDGSSFVAGSRFGIYALART